jgi:hypothetical protein
VRKTKRQTRADNISLWRLWKSCRSKNTELVPDRRHIELLTTINETSSQNTSDEHLRPWKTKSTHDPRKTLTQTEQLQQSTRNQEPEDSELRSYPWMKSINFHRTSAPSHTHITSNHHIITTKTHQTNKQKKPKPTCGNNTFKNPVLDSVKLTYPNQIRK